MIGIDSERVTAFVEPNMFMDKLVRKTLSPRLMTFVAKSSRAVETLWPISNDKDLGMSLLAAHRPGNGPTSTSIDDQ